MRVKPIETISTEDVPFLLSDYLVIRDSDNDTTIRIKKMLQRLPFIKKVVFVLIMERHTTRAIGEFLRISPTTVSRYYRETISALKEKLGGNTEGFETEEEVW